MKEGTPPPSDDSSESGHPFPDFRFCLVVLLLRKGMRLDEILNLKAEDIDLQQRRLSITSRKTRKTRYLTITPEVFGLLRGYLRHRECFVRPARNRCFRLWWLRRLR